MHLHRCLHLPLRAPKHTCRPATVAVATARSRAVTVSAALQLGPFEFANKEEARDKIRSLLRTTYNGEMILPASEDGQLLLSLLQQHPRAAHKIGAGASYFSTARRWDHGVATKHFVLHRIDGSSTDFSYLKCLKMAHAPRHQDAAAAAAAAATASAAAADVIGAVSADGVYQMDPSSSDAPSGSSSSSSRVRRVSRSPQSSSESSSPGSSLQSLEDPTVVASSSSSGWDIFKNNRYNRGFQYDNQDSLRRRAMRVAVAGQLQAFKTAAFAQASPSALVCPFTGEPLDLDQSRAVERDATPFLQLVDSWLQQQGIGLQDVQVGFREGQPNPYMSSTEQRWSWEDYYQQHAQLQVVSNVGFGRWQNERKGQGLFVGRRSSNDSRSGDNSSSRGSSSSSWDCSGSPSARRGSRRSSSASDAPASSSGGGSSGGGCGGGASGLGADAAAAVAAAFTTGGTVNAGQQHASSSRRGSSTQAAGELSSSSSSRSGAANASSASNSSEAVAQPANDIAHDSESGSTGSSAVSSSSSTVSRRSRRSRRSTQSKGNGMDPAQPSGSAAAAAATATAAETTAAAAAVAASGRSASDKDVSADVGAVSRRRRRRA